MTPEEIKKAIARLEKANAKWPDPHRQAKINKLKDQLKNK